MISLCLLLPCSDACRWQSQIRIIRDLLDDLQVVVIALYQELPSKISLCTSATEFLLTGVLEPFFLHPCRLLALPETGRLPGREWEAGWDHEWATLCMCRITLADTWPAVLGSLVWLVPSVWAATVEGSSSDGVCVRLLVVVSV